MKSPAAVRTRPPLTDRISATAMPAMEAFAGLKRTDRAAHEEILHRAYAIWEREGHPADRQLAHWLEAETAVLGHA